MNKNELKDRSVYINGKNVITNWREVKLFTPENTHDNIRVNETVKKEIKKKTEITQKSNSSKFATTC